MAAIDLTKLDQQIQELLTYAQEPKVFQTRFHSFLEFFHRYAHRKQKDALPKSFMRHYDLPDKVLPYLQNRLRSLAPDEALAISRQLWQDDFFEARDTAASLLGQLPPRFQNQVLELILAWIEQPLDRAVVDSVFTKAIRTIEENNRAKWVEEVGKLLLAARPQQRKMGLFALTKLIPSSDSNDLPAFFSWIRPFLIDPDSSLDVNLRPVVAALAQKTDRETAYLLREVLADSNDAHVGRRFRHYLEFFDEASQKRLLEAIKNQLVLSRSTISQ